MQRLIPGLALLLSLVLAPLASAQIDLPKTPPKPGPEAGGGDGETPGSKPPAPRPASQALVCSICYEPNTITPIDPNANNGLQRAYCKVCQKGTLHHVPKGLGGDGELDLPGGGARPVDTPPQDVPADTGGLDRKPGDPLAGLGGAVRVVLDEVGRRKRIDDPIVEQAVTTLASMGEPGLVGARLALLSDHAPTAACGGRVLLASGEPEELDRVVGAIGQRMPGGVGPLLLRELVERDPVRATPRFLCELLAHPETSMRAAAHRVLITEPRPALVPHLSLALGSDNGDARYRAIDVLSRIQDPSTLPLLFEHLDDERCKVACRVVETLARSEEPVVEQELLLRAFSERWILRPQAYALLALIEREDARLEPILGPDHQDALLRGMEVSDPFVSGVCSAALAGVGFRSPDPLDTVWLDDAVPHRLVALAVGRTFFEDRDALHDVAVRRLQLITGRSFGQDGRAWAEWWLSNEGTFHASRAVLRVEPRDTAQLRLDVVDRAQGERYTLLGPAWQERAVPEGMTDSIYLSDGETSDLLEFLRAQGLFGVERLPGTRGTDPARGRNLQVVVGNQAKSFTFSPGSEQAWFDDCWLAASSLRESHRWQRFPHPDLHGGRLGLVRAEGEFFANETDPVVRGRHEKALVLSWMEATPVDQRELGIAELERLFAREGVADEGDFAPLVERLSEETFWSERSARLTDLVRLAGNLVAGAPRGEVEAKLGEDLISLLLERFDVSAAEPVAELLELGGRERLRDAAVDERPLLRGIASAQLVLEPTETDLELLSSLVEDPVPAVQAATLRAVGRAQVTELREDVMLQAGFATGAVRAEALRAMGRIGGEGARDVLLTSLTEPSGTYRLPAAEGLSELRDPRTSEVFLSLLRSNQDPAVQEAARRGLLRLGDDARDTLLTALRSPASSVRREAALILSYQGEPRAVPPLLRALQLDPADRRVMKELLVLTCQDMSGELEPADAWWAWWDSVTHDESLPWFRAACEVRGVPSPASEAFERGGRHPGAIRFLVQALKLQDEYLVERARRELELVLDRELPGMPSGGVERAMWIEALEDSLEIER